MPLRRGGTLDGGLVATGQENPTTTRLLSSTAASSSRKRNQPFATVNDRNTYPTVSARLSASRKPLMDHDSSSASSRLTTRKPLGNSKTNQPSKRTSEKFASSLNSSTRNGASGSHQSQQQSQPKRVSHSSISRYNDKENSVSTRQAMNNKKRGGGSKVAKTPTSLNSSTSISTSKTISTTTSATERVLSSRKVTFMSPTNVEPLKTPKNRGGGLNSLRRSLRETITPPSQKKKSRNTPVPVQPVQLLPSPLSTSTLPSDFQSPSSLDGNDTNMIFANATPSSHNALCQPKTPKSILKEQLEMSLDESMLLSPSGGQALNASLLLGSTLSQSRSSECSNPKNLATLMTTTVEAPCVSNKENPNKALSPATTTTQTQVMRTSAISKSKMQRSVFSGSKTNVRKTLRNKSQKSSILSSAPSAAVAVEKKRVTNADAVESSAQAQPQQAPYETPYIIHDVKKEMARETSAETPFSQRGNGVCLDLTSMFFGETKTVRKGNKSETAVSGIKSTSTASDKEHAQKEEQRTNVNGGLPDQEEWAEMQCDTFSKWLNFTLQPTAIVDDLDHQGDADSAVLAATGDSKGDAHPLSHSERVGLRTLMLHQQLAKARVAASALFAKDEMKQIKAALESEMKKGKLAIRADRDMYADLSQRKKIMMLLLSYSTPWLRLGLETLFNETILPEVPSQLSPMKPKHGGAAQKAPANQLRTCLRNFIVERVLTDSAVLAKYTKGRCKVPSGNFEKRYRAEIRALVLRRLLVLIFFLDRAKKANILDQSPRLFTKNAAVKSTRDVLISFCRDFLASEGDITRHLGRVGLKVFYKQEPVDEIVFHIANFAVDLRDGIRLTRVAEILTGGPPKSLLNTLRIPAVSRLQKLHNVGVALEALRKSGVLIPGDVAAHHIVDGHRAMVLKLMWVMISHYCFPAVLDFEKVEEEISLLQQKLREKQQFHQDESPGTPGVVDRIDSGKALLLRWCRAVCALFGLDILNFSTSFADGKALCYLVHYYHPRMLALDEIRPTTRDSKHGRQQRYSSIDQMRYNEKMNSSLAHTRLAGLGGIPKMIPTSDTSNAPDEKSMMVYLCYACSRLIDSRREVQACLQIQHLYRKHRQRTLVARQSKAAITILKAWRTGKAVYYYNVKMTYAGPVAKIEEFILKRRERLSFMRAMRLKKEVKDCAAIKIQVQIRGYIAEKRVDMLRRQYKIALNLQRSFRMKRAQKIFMDLFNATSASIRLQSLWRGYTSRREVLVMLSSIILVQAQRRKQMVRRKFVQKKTAAVCIQRIWRGFWGQLQMQLDLLDIITVQSIMRRKAAMKLRLVRTNAIHVLQRGIRCFLARQRYSKRRSAAVARLRDHDSAIFCQRVIRGFLAARKTSGKRLRFVAATIIQREWRAKQIRSIVTHSKNSATKIQCLFRMVVARRGYSSLRSSAVTIQSFWRSFWRRLETKCAISIQANVRMRLGCVAAEKRKHGALLLQRSARHWLARLAARNRRLLHRVQSAITLQSWGRSQIQKARCQAILAQVVKLQAFARGFLAREIIHQQRQTEQKILNILTSGETLRQETTRATICLQTRWRGSQSRRVFGTKRHLATTLSAVFKGNRVRAQLQEQHQHATTIQSFLRKKSAQCTRTKQLIAVIKLQAVLRAFHVASLYRQRKAFATKIQDWVRAINSRRKITQKLQSQLTVQSLLLNSRTLSRSTYEASRWIQSQWRAHRHRVRYLHMRDRVVSIQACIRGFSARADAGAKKKQIVLVQTLTRRNQKRTQYLKLQRGIKLLQGCVRARRLTGELACIKGKIVVLQANTRQFLKRREFLRLQHGTIVIQSRWRRLLARRRYQHIVEKIVKIQSHIRRNHVHQEVLFKRSTVSNLQVLCRSWLARRRMLERKQQKDMALKAAALALQALVRGYAVRKQLQHLHDSATTIQKTWRGFSAMVDYHMDLYEILVLQTLARQFLAQREVANRRVAIVCLQSAARRFLSNRQAKNLLAERQVLVRRQQNAIRIQSVLRGYLARKKAKTERAARSIQKSWRCYTVHVDFLIVILGTISIQRYARGHIARQHFQLKRSVALLLQRVWRGSRARAVASKKRIEAKKNFAATQIQRSWRGYSQNCSFLLMTFCAVRIQQHVRIFLAKKYKASLEDERMELLRPIAAALIQGAARKYLARGTFQKMVRSVTAFQRLVRGHRVRRKCTKKVRKARESIRKANLKAEKYPHMQLGARTIAALTVIQTSTRLCQIMTVVASLEIATRYSRSCCEAFAHAKATDTLLALIKQSNRSLPHLELLNYILLTFKNVAKYNHLLTYVATPPAAQIFLDLVQMFRDKDFIFCLSVGLLERCIAFDEETRMICKAYESQKRLKAVYELTRKKISSFQQANARYGIQYSSRKNPKPQCFGGQTPDITAGNRTLGQIIESLQHN